MYDILPFRSSQSRAGDILIVMVWLACSASWASAQTTKSGEPVLFTLEGFSAPYRTINLATSESGILAELIVREGEHVKLGDRIARLDCEVHSAQLALARAGMEAQGELESATAERNLRARRVELLRQLLQEQHARQEEVDRAATDLAIADANRRGAEERIAMKRLEYERIRLQIEQRTIRSPVAGVISSLRKLPGEYVGPNEPVVATLLQVDTLAVNVLGRPEQVASLKIGQTVEIRFQHANLTAKGTIEIIAPNIDAESTTMSVRIRVPNPDGKLLPGDRCEMIRP